jgi:hypothetical protein
VLKTQYEPPFTAIATTISFVWGRVASSAMSPAHLNSANGYVLTSACVVGSSFRQYFQAKDRLFLDIGATAWYLLRVW